MARTPALVALTSLVTGVLGLAACGDDGGGSAAEFCSLEADFDTLGTSFDRIDAGFEGLGAGDATAAKAAFAALYDALDDADTLIDDAKDKAPDEIADDFGVIADSFGDVVAALPDQADVDAAIDANDLGTLQRLFDDFGTSVSELGSSAEIGLASAELSTFTSANCDPEPPAADPSSTASTVAAAAPGDDSAG